MAMQACLFSSSMLEVTSSNDIRVTLLVLWARRAALAFCHSIVAYFDLIKHPSLQVYAVEINFHTDLCD